MVLAELGGKLRESLRQLHQAASNSRHNSLSEKDLQSLLQDISRALIEADVHVPWVLQLREAVKRRVQPALSQLQSATAVTAAAAEQASDQDARAVVAAQAVQQRAAAQLAKTVQRAVIDELVALLTPKKTDNDSDQEVPSPPPRTRRGRQQQQQQQRQPQAKSTWKRGHPNIVLFVGLQGAGKTTTIGKYANYYARRGYKTGMICADTFRAGALDQLKQNATKLRIPFYGSLASSDPVQVAMDGVAQFKREHYELMLVDTSGRHAQQATLLSEMQEIAAAISPTLTVLVMDATQGQAVYDQAAAFCRAVDIGSVIITKLDGHAKGGGALSAVAATGAPIIFLGHGEHFDDLDPFDAQSFVSKLLGFGDVRGLMQAVQDVNAGDDAQELAERVAKGEFTLRMMYRSLEKMVQLGSMNKLVGMIPGMEAMGGGAGAADENTKRMRKFMIIMDSMTDHELDGLVNLHDYKFNPAVQSRIHRIAAGSGTHPLEVKFLLQSQKNLGAMFQKMNKSGMLNTAANKQQLAKKQQMIAQQIRKNPALIQQFINQMDPAMVQQMGGRDAVIQTMQQMAKNNGQAPAGGGMSDMAALMNNMGLGGGAPPPPAGGNMDMASMMKMAQQMRLGGGGRGRPTDDAMPDMSFR
jgi:signal recognition particle subunit SRP54